MASHDDCEILELEIDEEDTFGLYDEVGSPGKRRKVLEESVPDTVHQSVERTVTLLPTSQVPITLPTTSTPQKLSFMQYIQSSYNSTTRVNIYRNRIPLIYPEYKSRQIQFVPSEYGSDEEDNDFDTEFDSGIHSLVEEDPYRSAKPWANKLNLGPTPVQSFVDIAWNDKLGREFADNDLPNKEPTIMPHISRQEALKLISKTGPFFKNARSTDKTKICQIKSGGHVNAEVLKTFLLTVDAWRVLCFDTESNGKLLYNVGPNKGKEGRIPVVFGNPAGMVLIFHDSRQTPIELIERCADFRYIKLQSGIENDIHYLQKNGFRVFRGVVDIQTLITLVRPAIRQCGIEFCTQYVWGDDEDRIEYEDTPKKVYKDKIRIKWSESFNPCYKREDFEKLALNHSLQDVLTPFAILIKIGLEITELRGQAENPDENIFLTMNEALELCVSKAPADIRNTNHGYLARVIKEDKLINWVNDSAVTYCTPFQFSSHALVHRIRRARSDLVEFHHTDLRWDEIQTLALLHVDLLRGRMPFSSELKFLDLRFHLMDHCSHCGSLEHRSDQCSELTIPCCYDHGPDFDVPAHSIVCCPALHAYCQKCFIRGHFTESHGKGWKSAAQLRRQFLESAPQGLFTSLLYLIRTDLTAANILPHHFRLGISGRRLIQSYGDYWLYRGLGAIPDNEKEKGKRYLELATQNLRSTPTSYEPLRFDAIVNTNEKKARDILVEKGVITEGKRLSGSQRRKRRRLTLELDAEEKARNNPATDAVKEVRVHPE